MISTQTQESVVSVVDTRVSSRFMNSEAAKVLAGVSLGAIGCYVPFASSFALAQCAHLNAASVAGYGMLISIAGLVGSILTAIAVYHARKSLKLLCALTFTMMTLIGALVSFTI